MVPTRNSSSTGVSRGAVSDTSVEAMAGTGALPPVRRTTSSSNSSIRSASAATWVFSRATLVTLGPEDAWRKKVRRPGNPTVPATKRSGGS
jgi:hypothetical protein